MKKKTFLIIIISELFQIQVSSITVKIL